jgi:hypothetical protein
MTKIPTVAFLLLTLTLISICTGNPIASLLRKKLEEKQQEASDLYYATSTGLVLLEKNESFYRQYGRWDFKYHGKLKVEYPRGLSAAKNIH